VSFIGLSSVLDGAGGHVTLRHDEQQRRGMEAITAVAMMAFHCWLLLPM
jgi:hypothetical protein